MKIILLIAFTILTAKESFACTPPLPMEGQRWSLMRVLQSDELTKELLVETEKNFDVRIESVKFDPEIKIELSNECKISARLIYLPPEDPGLCPKFERVELTKRCKKEDDK